MKPWYLSKTINTAIATLCGGVLMAIEKEDWQWLIVSLLGVWNAYVRFKTTESINPGKSDE